MINKPNQNCEFGCQSNDCKHTRHEQVIDLSTVRDGVELVAFDSMAYLELTEWIDQDLEALAERFEPFATPASRRRHYSR